MNKIILSIIIITAIISACHCTKVKSKRVKRIALPNQENGSNMLISIPTQSNQNEEEEILTEDRSENGGQNEGFESSDNVQIQIIQKSQRKVTRVGSFVISSIAINTNHI